LDRDRPDDASGGADRHRRGDRLSLAPSGLAGLGAAVLPWLLSAGTLVLGLPASVDRLAEAVAEHAADHVGAAPFARRLSERLDAHKASANLLVVSGDRLAEVELPRGTAAVDVITLGERALIARRRRDPPPPPLIPLGAIGAPSRRHRADPGRDPAARHARPARRTVASGPRRHRRTGWSAAPWCLRRPGQADRTGLARPAARGRRLGAHRHHRPPRPRAVAQPDPDRPRQRDRRTGALEFDLTVLDALFRDVGDFADAAAVPLRDEDGFERLAAAVVPKPAPPSIRRASSPRWPSTDRPAPAAACGLACSCHRPRAPSARHAGRHASHLMRR
jgi:hypothetical protein